MREKHGDDSSFFIWLATNLYHNDPDMLTAVLEGHFGAGYEMEALFPAIRCPVLLLQADPVAGGVMSDAEVAQAVRLLPSVKHVRLQNTGHNIFFPDGELALRAVFEFLKAN